MLKVLTARHTLLCWRLRRTKLRRVSLSRQIKWQRLLILPPLALWKNESPHSFVRQAEAMRRKLVPPFSKFVVKFCSFFFFSPPLISTPKSEKRDKYKLAGAACAHMIGSGVSVFQKAEHIIGETDCGRRANDTPSNQAKRVI